MRIVIAPSVQDGAQYKLRGQAAGQGPVGAAVALRARPVGAARLRPDQPR